MTIASVSAFSSAQASAAKGATVSNKNRVEKALRDWTAGTGHFTDFLADDIRWTITGNSLVAGTTVGKQALMDKVLQPFGARFAASDDKFRPVAVKGIYADGDVVVAMFDCKGTANDGKPYVNSYAWFLTFRDGQVVTATAFFDSIAFDDLWRRVTPQHA